MVGVINYEFIDWRERDLRSQDPRRLCVAMAGIPGVDVEVRVPDAGPPTGKPIQVQLSAADPTGLNDYAKQVAAAVAKVPGVIDLSDGLPPPGVDWALEVDRSEGGAVRRQPDGGGHRRAAGDHRPEADPTIAPPAPMTRWTSRLRLPEDRRTLAVARRIAHRDGAGLGADLQLRHAQSGADRGHR